MTLPEACSSYCGDSVGHVRKFKKEQKNSGHTVMAFSAAFVDDNVIVRAELQSATVDGTSTSCGLEIIHLYILHNMMMGAPCHTTL